MKTRSGIAAILLALLVVTTLIVFQASTRSSPLTGPERSFVGEWILQPTGDRIVFEPNRTWKSGNGEFSGRWRIDNGKIFFETWRDAPQTFDWEFANTVTRPIANGWDSLFAEEESWQLAVVDENTAKIRDENNDWQFLKRSE